MEVFDLQITDEELGEVLARVYQQAMVVQSYELEVHSELPTRRLAKANIYVQATEGVKNLELLIKESSRHELATLSLANKVLPYSSPRVVLYKFFSKGAWIFLENISTWIDVQGRDRVNERIVDGLYAIHKVFIGDVGVLSSNFSMFPVAAEDQLRANISRTLDDIELLRGDRVVAELFENWSAVRECIDERLNSAEPLVFPMTLLHGSYYPNTVRGLIDSRGTVHIVAYDWQYAAVGWPQIDLALLLDRLDLIAAFQGHKWPSPVLRDRYWMQLHEAHPNLNHEQFLSTYDFCYLHRALPLVRWWMKGLIQHPTRDPARPILEIKMKLAQILGDEV